MCKTIKPILMLLFSLVASSAWADIGDVDTEGYSMVTRNQTSTIRVQDIQVTNVVEEGAECPENGRQARNANGAPLFCQSGVWKTALAGAKIRTVFSEFGNIANPHTGSPDVGLATCNADEIVIAGGGNCQNGGIAWLHTSGPHGNGWMANCYAGNHGDNPAQAIAICLSIR
ncbi:hypothetical protein KQH49_03605 [Mycetohabitans sp. B5]|uniref:hypothetical protein n=1 Tax=Mycetohabitans TaxID=2571159 RepID=UPI0011B0BE35|nr:MULTISPECIES: hypothetical protein [Mycetohabitans]MCG1054097.1 hypothetical protein [Mycetohabitans sp. B5]